MYSVAENYTDSYDAVFDTEAQYVFYDDMIRYTAFRTAIDNPTKKIEALRKELN